MSDPDPRVIDDRDALGDHVCGRHIPGLVTPCWLLRIDGEQIRIYSVEPPSEAVIEAVTALARAHRAQA